MFAIMIGYLMFFLGDLLQADVDTVETVKFLSLSGLVFIQQGLLWFLPPLLIEIWLQRFIDECGEIKTAKYNCEYCVNVYEKFESSLKNFFLFFYSSSQIYSIVATFLSFSSFLTNISFEFPKLLSLFGLMLSVSR